jgi:hypothetical protein
MRHSVLSVLSLPITLPGENAMRWLPGGGDWALAAHRMRLTDMRASAAYLYRQAAAALLENGA